VCAALGAFSLFGHLCQQLSGPSLGLQGTSVACSDADRLWLGSHIATALSRMSFNSFAVGLGERVSSTSAPRANSARPKRKRLRCIAADSPDSFLDDTPTAVLVRQVLGAVAQFEKQALVAKLRKARERKKRETGKCGGRHSLAETKPETVALAKKLARYPVNGRRRSLREIAAELQTAGHVTSRGTSYGAAAIARMTA
jgi:hypothetical protein